MGYFVQVNKAAESDKATTEKSAIYSFMDQEQQDSMEVCTFMGGWVCVYSYRY